MLGPGEEAATMERTDRSIMLRVPELALDHLRHDRPLGSPLPVVIVVDRHGPIREPVRHRR